MQSRRKREWGRRRKREIERGRERDREDRKKGSTSRRSNDGDRTGGGRVWMHMWENSC